MSRNATGRAQGPAQKLIHDRDDADRPKFTPGEVDRPSFSTWVLARPDASTTRPPLRRFAAIQVRPKTSCRYRGAGGCRVSWSPACPPGPAGPPARAIRHPWLTESSARSPPPPARPRAAGGSTPSGRAHLGRVSSVGYHARGVAAGPRRPAGCHRPPKHRRGRRPDATASSGSSPLPAVTSGGHRLHRPLPVKPSCPGRWCWLPARVG